MQRMLAANSNENLKNKIIHVIQCCPSTLGKRSLVSANIRRIVSKISANGFDFLGEIALIYKIIAVTICCCAQLLVFIKNRPTKQNNYVNLYYVLPTYSPAIRWKEQIHV